VSSIIEFVRRYRVACALAFLVVVVVGPVVATNTAQPQSRIALTAALVEHHSVNVDPYAKELGIDYSVYRGHLRSDKAPGQPIFAIPAYALTRVVGAPSAAAPRVNANLQLWFLTFWSATLPLAALVALLYVECRRFAAAGPALAVALLFGFATMFLPFGANLFAHILAALCAFGAWMLVSRRPLTPRRAAIAGLVAGCGVLMEYEAAIVAAVLVGYVVVRERRQIVPFLAGAVPAMLVLGWYQWRAFGAPWHTPATFYNTKSGYEIPSLHQLWWMFAGARGLWVGAPLAIVGIGTAIWVALAARGALRDAAVFALAVFVPYFILCAGWSGTPGLVDPGPRYLIPALPFLAIPLAARWNRVFVIAVPASVLGAFIALGATWTSELAPLGANLPAAYRYFLAHKEFQPTLWSMGFGTTGSFLYALTVVGAVAVLVAAYRYRTDVRSAVSEPLR
jgi:hypothetical protein